MKILLPATAIVIVIGGILGYQYLSTQKPTPTTSTVAPQTNINPSASGSAQAGEAIQVTFDASEYKFTPPTVVVNPGQKVTVTIKNTGNMPHDWVVEGANISTQIIEPGKSSTMTFTAPSKSGQYTTFCSVGSHRAMGMEGKLIVQ